PIRGGCGVRLLDLPRRRRIARALLRGRILSVSLLGPDVHGGGRGGARGRRHGPPGWPTGGRHLRWLGTSDANAGGALRPGPDPRRSVLRKGLAGATVYRPRLRAGVLRRQLAD